MGMWARPLPSRNAKIEIYYISKIFEILEIFYIKYSCVGVNGGGASSLSQCKSVVLVLIRQNRVLLMCLAILSHTSFCNHVEKTMKKINYLMPACGGKKSSRRHRLFAKWLGGGLVKKRYKLHQTQIETIMTIIW